jgi:hypothetical protein
MERLSANERLVVERFGGDECLFRDHRGDRVLLDVEGRGTYRVVDASKLALRIEVDGVVSNAPEGSFNEYVQVATPDGGRFEGFAALGRTSAPSGSSLRCSGYFEGAGWLLSAPSIVVLDDRHEAAPDLPHGGWLPFFRSVRSDGDFQVIRAACGPASPIQVLDIGDDRAMKAAGVRVQNMSKVAQLDSAYGDGTLRSGRVASHLNAFQWTLDLPPGCEGLILRRHADRFHGRQRARVLVDGSSVGVWYDPRQDRIRRWFVSDFGVPAEFVAGKERLSLAVDPLAGASLWSVGRIEVFALTSLPSP